MKGLFIPNITEEMFRNCCLESIETLMAEGEIHEIEYPTWTSISEAMPTETGYYLIQYSRKYSHDELAVAYYSVERSSDLDYEWEFRPMEHEYQEVVAWMPLPQMYKTGREE